MMLSANAVVSGRRSYDHSHFTPRCTRWPSSQQRFHIKPVQPTTSSTCKQRSLMRAYVISTPSVEGTPLALITSALISKDSRLRKIGTKEKAAGSIMAQQLQTGCSRDMIVVFCPRSQGRFPLAPWSCHPLTLTATLSNFDSARSRFQYGVLCSAPGVGPPPK